MIEDAIDGGLGDGSHDWKDYLGAAVSGLFGGMGAGFFSDAIISAGGSFLDAVISGDLQENGFWSTMGNIAVSTIVSIGVGVLGNVVASKIKANSLIKMGNKNKANQILEKMGAVGKMGKKTNSQLSKIIRKSNWIGNLISDKLSSSLGSNISTRLFDDLVNN